MIRLVYPIRIWIFRERIRSAGQVREHIREIIDRRAHVLRAARRVMCEKQFVIIGIQSCTANIKTFPTTSDSLPTST
jgi:hypothetical protein